MGDQRAHHHRRNIFVLISVIITFFLLRNKFEKEPANAIMSSDIVSNLQVSIRQVSSPSKLGISVTNTNDKPVTILTWNSPLDPLALQLGLVAFTPAGSDKPLDIPTIQVRRKMPPERDSLATVAAGETRELELELREPIVPLGRLRGTAVSVVCRGEWMGVWVGEADGISQESLENLGAGPDAFKGSFQSEAVDIEF